MSTVYYPVGLIEDLKVERIDRTIVDAFEDGSSAANSIWTLNTFKRRFTIKHAPLSQAEFRYLRDFFVARSGRYDPFWFRDNVHRGGWAYARLAAPVPERRGASGYYKDIELILEQTAPIRDLVGVDDIAAALGAAGSGDAPLAWWDANRGIAYSHAGTAYGETVVKDRSGNGYDLGWINPTSKAAAGLASGAGGQLYDIYRKTNGQYATGAQVGINGPALGAVAQPAMTIMVIMYNHGVYAGPFVIAGVGWNAGGALGLQLNNNELKPWVGGNEAWTAATVPDDVFCSIAATWPVGSNVATSWVNGTSTAAGSNTRSYTRSAFSYMGALDGTKENFGVQTYVPHVLFFNATLTQAQIKAVHNLFVHQYSGYGMAAV